MEHTPCQKHRETRLWPSTLSACTKYQKYLQAILIFRLKLKRQSQFSLIADHEVHPFIPMLTTSSHITCYASHYWDPKGEVLELGKVKKSTQKISVKWWSCCSLSQDQPWGALLAIKMLLPEYSPDSSKFSYKSGPLFREFKMRRTQRNWQIKKLKYVWWLFLGVNLSVSGLN